MVNNTGQKICLITEDDGELLFKVNQGESFTVRSAKQTKRDKYYSPKVKITGRFIKTMDKEKELVDLLLDSPSTYLAISIMKRYIVTNYNVLVKDGIKYGVQDLAKDMKISRQMASNHIRKLESINVLAKLETDRGKLFCINPKYYFRGEEVPESVLKLFEN
jgi:CTP-dependent riboflavin kinase